MGSSIDVTKPTSGKAYTADVRQNFAYAKAEIEALQNLYIPVEISVFNFLTTAQVADVRAGVLSFDASTAIQAAIDSANALATAVDTRSAIIVRIPAGKYDVRVQLLVKAHVDIVCDGILRHNLVSLTDFLIWFKNKSHCTKLSIDANGRSGALFGEIATTCDMRISDVRIVGTGAAVNTVGVRIWGEGFTVGSIVVDGGQPGIDLGDGGTNFLTRLNARCLRSYSAFDGIRIDKCESVNISQIVADSSNHLGIRIDRSSDIFVAEAMAYFNDAAPGGVFLYGAAIDFGANSAGRPNKNITFKGLVVNTAGAIAAIANTDYCNIHLQGALGTLYSGNASPIGSGIIYGVGNGANGFVELELPGALANVGVATFAERQKKVTRETCNFPITASSFATTASGEYKGQYRVSKSADQNYNATVVLANITDLTFAVGANEEWHAIFYLSVGAALATTGIKLAITAPAAITSIEYDAVVIPALYAAANKGMLRAAAAATTLDFTSATQATVTDALIVVMVRVENGANAGNIAIQACQSTNSGTNLTIRKGSIVQANRVT